MKLFSFNCDSGYWMKVPRVQTHTAAQRIPGCGKGEPYRWGWSDYNTERMTMCHCWWRVWRVPCLLHAKDLFCLFRKRVVVLQPLQQTTIFVPIQHSILVHLQIKVVNPIDPAIPAFLYCFYNEYSWNNVRWTLKRYTLYSQSINQSISYSLGPQKNHNRCL